VTPPDHAVVEISVSSTGRSRTSLGSADEGNTQVPRTISLRRSPENRPRECRVQIQGMHTLDSKSDWFKRVIEVGLLFVLPLVFSRAFTEQFTYPKKYLAEILIIAGFAVWVLRLLWGKAIWPGRFSLSAPLVLLSSAVLISCVNSAAAAFSFQDSVSFICGPVWVLLLLSEGGGEATVRRTALLAVLAGTLVSAIALLQWAGHDPLLYSGYRIDWGGMVARMHLYSTLGNPNFVAGYLAGTVFLALGYVLAASDVWMKALGSVAAGAMVAAIVGTGSRGAWAGLGIGLFVGAQVWRPWRSRNTVAWKAQKGDQVGRVGVFVLPLLFILASWSVRGQIAVLLGRLWGRMYLWRCSWPMFTGHPLLGNGWGTYQLKYLELQAEFLASHPQLRVYWTNNRLLHNDPLQLLLETGLLGCVALGWVLWAYVRETVTAPGGECLPSTRGWLASGMGGVTAMLIDSLFNFQFSVPPTFLLICTLLAFPSLLAKDSCLGEGLMTKAIPRRRQSSLSPKAQDASALVVDGESPGRCGNRRWLRVGASVLVLTSAGALVFERSRLMLAERDYRSGSLLEDRGDLAMATEAYSRGRALNPLNGRLHFGLARVYYLTHRFPEALTEVMLAEHTYADSHLEVLKGRIQDQMGMGRAALATYRHALELDPTLKSVQADIARLSKDE
jgi:O-antigen ligase